MKNKKLGASGRGWPNHLGQSSMTSGAARNAGTALPTEVRQQMEGQFGADFSDVRVHTNSAVVTGNLSDTINARAYTAGSDIFFAPGQYNPSTGAGRHLLAHELTHVVQQRNAE